MFEKVDVNGENASDIYKYLKANCSEPVTDIKWNFAKFLVNGDGKVQKHYAPMTSPFKMRTDIEQML